MSYYFDVEAGAETELPVEDILKSVADEALSELGCPYKAGLSLSLVTEDTIKERNREFRGRDSVTDVLSFPMQSFPEPGDFSCFEEGDPEAFDLSTGELVLGDIVICTYRMREQAEEYGHSEKREMAFLIAHSVLHLCGFDHEAPEDAALMEERQEQILNNLGIYR